MRQPLRDAVVDEFITIKTRQAVGSAEPKEATRIGNDLVDAVARKAVSGCVDANWKLFGALLRTRNQNEDEDGDRSFHGADIIVIFRRLRLRSYASITNGESIFALIGRAHECSVYRVDHDRLTATHR